MLSIAAGLGRIGTWRLDAQTDRFEERGLWMELLGYSPAEQLRTSRDLLGYVHPDDIRRMQEAYRDYLKGVTQEYDFEHRLRALDGTYYWVLSRARVTARAPDGRALHLEGVYVDLSRLKATEVALRQSQDFLRLVLDTIPVRVFWKDIESRYLGCNRAYADDAGLPDTGAIKGLLDEDLPWTENAELYRADDRAAMQGGGRARFHLQRSLVDAGGILRRLETSKVPLLNAEGTVVGVLGIFQDVSERYQRERDLIEQRQRLDIAISNSQQGFWEWDVASGELTTLETQHDRAVDPLVPATVAILWARLKPTERRLLRRALVGYLRGRTTLFEEEVHLCLSDGPARWILLRGKTVERDAKGKARRLMGTHIDVTSMKTTEIALDQARHFLSTVIDTIPQAVYWKDHDSRYLGCNKTFANLAGLRNPSEIEGLADQDLPWRDLAMRLRGEDEDTLTESRNHIIAEDYVRNGHGDEIWVEKHKVPFRGPDGRIMGILGTTHDITERKRSEDQIEQLAYFDPLTHLPNRRYFKERLDAAVALAQRSQAAGALLYLDLDHFKKVNDTLGHSAGDRLLVEASARIKALLRQGDVVARIGGDEFMIMLGDLSMDTQRCAQQARAVAHKVRGALSRPFSIDDEELFVTATIGIAVYPEHHDSTEQLLKMADAAMYRGKREGRNTVFFFDPELLAEAEARLRLEALLRGAINRGELSLHYQPQVDAEGNLVGAEALMRWCHPGMGNVSPAQFIPIAEESGLIDELGLWAIKEALAALERWHAAGIETGDHLAVNVSQRQFSSPHFVQDVIQVLRTAAVPRGALVLELTETSAAESVEDTIAKMEQLRAAGVSFSIDDFGVGYSSLSYLTRLPLRQLKIDRSFIIDVERDRTKSAIIATLLTLGENLGLHVVAEGVETPAQCERLIERGCRAFQGYLFSHPLCESDFIAFCQASSRKVDEVAELTLQQIA